MLRLWFGIAGFLVGNGTEFDGASGAGLGTEADASEGSRLSMLSTLTVRTTKPPSNSAWWVDSNGVTAFAAAGSGLGCDGSMETGGGSLEAEFRIAGCVSVAKDLWKAIPNAPTKITAASKPARFRGCLARPRNVSKSTRPLCRWVLHDNEDALAQIFGRSFCKMEGGKGGVVRSPIKDRTVLQPSNPGLQSKSLACKCPSSASMSSSRSESRQGRSSPRDICQMGLRWA
jgi:hypothetical protein